MSLTYGHKMLGVYEEVKVDAIRINEGRRALDSENLKIITKSIADRGLIQPIVLYKENDTYHLLAGAHRLQAMKDLKMEKIGARVYDYMLNPYELKAIEIYENLHRKNLNDMERIQQTSELHSLMQRIHGPALHAGAVSTSSAKGHSIRDTARILNVSVGSVHGDIKLARLFQSVPELKKVIDPNMNRSTIKRVLQRINTVISNRNVAAQSDRFSTLAENYILGDFFDNKLPSGNFALIECDPPYGIELNTTKDLLDKTNMLEYEDIPEKDYPSFLQKLCKECYRLGSDNSWLILWYSIKYYPHVIAALEAAGYEYNYVPALWLKRQVGTQFKFYSTLSPYMVLGGVFEQFIYARKGSPSLYKAGRENVFEYAQVPAHQKIHATERPVDLMVELINTFVGPNTNVLVPFAGSGATIVAAAQLNCHVIGYDKSEIHRDAFVAKQQKEQQNAC